MVQLGAMVEPRPRGVHFAGEFDLGLQAKSSFALQPSPFLPTTDSTDGGTAAAQLPASSFQRWETQRGCAFSCSFCQHRGTTQSVELMREDRIAAELRYLVDTGTQKINVVDPTFNHNQAHYVSVLDGIHSCALSLQTRPEKVTRRFLDSVENSSAEVTLECGVQTFEPSELNLIGRIRGGCATATSNKVDEKLALIKERGVKFEGTLIFGLPHQTVDSFMRSLDKAHKTGATTVSAFPLMLLRGTELHARRHELGLVEGSEEEGFVPPASTERIQDFIPHVVETPTMSTAEWIRMGEIAAACT
jgi:radical SAM superfamily enzyme